MKRIDSVLHVLGERYTVRMRKLDCKGKCHANGRIEIDPRQSVDKMRDTLLHEAIHALDNVQRLQLSERQTRLIATGLRTVFCANKNFAKFVSA